MQERYSVLINPDENPMPFITATDIVVYLANNKIAHDVIIRDTRYSELNINIKCNIQTGVVEAVPNVASNINIQESYPFMTKPIEIAISNFAVEILRKRLSDNKDPAINAQIKEKILKELPKAPAPLMSSFVNFSVFVPSQEKPKKLEIGEKSFDLKSLSLNDVDDILLLAKQVTPARTLGIK